MTASRLLFSPQEKALLFQSFASLLHSKMTVRNGHSPATLPPLPCISRAKKRMLLIALIYTLVALLAGGAFAGSPAIPAAPSLTCSLWREAKRAALPPPQVECLFPLCTARALFPPSTAQLSPLPSHPQPFASQHKGEHGEMKAPTAFHSVQKGAGCSLPPGSRQGGPSQQHSFELNIPP